MGQITIRMEDREIEMIDTLLKRKGLETRSELLRRAWSVYKIIDEEEKKGKVIVAMPAEKLKNEPVLIAI